MNRRQRKKQWVKDSGLPGRFFKYMTYGMWIDGQLWKLSFDKEHKVFWVPKGVWSCKVWGL